MERTASEILAKCIKGNQVESCCMRMDCQEPASMCVEDDCECQKSHPLCTRSPKISKLKTSLEAKGRGEYKLLEEIYVWYETQIKLLTIEMEEVRGLMDNSVVSLHNNQERLYGYLVEGKSQMILSSLVADVVGSVFKEPECHSVPLQNLRNKLLHERVKIKEVVTEVRYLTQSPLNTSSPTLSNTAFLRQLCHPGIQIHNPHTVQSTDKSCLPALLPINLDGKQYKFKTLKYKFKLNKLTNQNFMIGVIQMPQNSTINTTFIHNKLENGSLTYYNNKVYLGKEEGHREEAMSVTGYAANDEVEVEYERGREKVTVRNITRNQHSLSYIKRREDLPLYVALQFSHKGDEVELIEVSSTQQ